jgi:hypothetical protein
MKAVSSRCRRHPLVAALLLLLQVTHNNRGVVHAQSIFDVFFPSCTAAIECTDPCLPCDAGAGCDTKPTEIRTGMFGWRVCPGCPKLDACREVQCCHLTTLPPADACGSSGCTCCSDGSWIVGNDNGWTSAKVCGELGLSPGAECQYYGCTKDLHQCDDGSTVGRDYMDEDCSFLPCPGDP